ncbi:MAG TPA: hypothetical protein VM819_09260 [Vicinamibacterales bacterium]|jgi:hypothetical protein|nr:hypothetical protein [Vicinamibacterales bacterium]
MLLAQGLGEYGMLVGQKGGAGGDSSAVRDIVQKVQDFVQNATPAQWAMIGGGLFLLWFVFLRRR